MSKTVLALVPHPDDAEFFAGGLIANLIDEGAKVYLAIASDGCRGSFEHDSATLAQIRRQEAQRAAQVLGAEPRSCLATLISKWIPCRPACCAKRLSA